jgi:hypothetical protein
VIQDFTVQLVKVQLPQLTTPVRQVIIAQVGKGYQGSVMMEATRMQQDKPHAKIVLLERKLF